MKIAPLIAALLVLCLAVPAATGAKGKKGKQKPKPPKPPTPAKTCLAKDGQDYEIGEGYLDTKTCIQYTCVKKRGKLKMAGKKMPKPCTNNVCETDIVAEKDCICGVTKCPAGSSCIGGETCIKGTGGLEENAQQTSIVGYDKAKMTKEDIDKEKIRIENVCECKVEHLESVGVFILSYDNPSHGSISSLNLDPSKEIGMEDQIVTIFNEVIPPTDPDFDKQWALQDLDNNADINAEEGWMIISDSNGGDSNGPSVVVAVIDTGVDYNHEDLNVIMWTNPGEIPNNGIDDDNNGIIDDVYGADFNSPVNGDPIDRHSHGTHCAGIIAAKENNGKGIAGVASFTQGKVKIMAIKGLSDSGGGYLSNLLKGLNYAIGNGATISSNSWGGGSGNGQLWKMVLQNNPDHLFVAAAGNSNKLIDDSYLPWTCGAIKEPNLLCVASSTQQDTRSSFSNYGKDYVHVFAPGSDIYSTIPGNGYDFKSGTSMACPQVSGLSALIRIMQPDLNAQQVREFIEANVQKKPQYENFVSSGGLIDMGKTLKGVTNGCPIGWTSLSTGCYLFNEVSGGDYEEAKTVCQEKGGFLAEINNQEEQDALWQFCQDNEIDKNIAWWLGATDKITEGEWKWERTGETFYKAGQSVTYDAFSTGEPNNAGNGEDCLVADSDGRQFEWVDIPCDTKVWKWRKVNALCEYPAEVSQCMCTTTECFLAKNTLQDTIQVLTRQFLISFEFQARKYTNGWQNVLHLTTGENCCGDGSRIPSVMIHASQKIEICFHGNQCDNIEINLTVNKWYKLEISQTKNAIDSNKYDYQIKLDGRPQQSKFNPNPEPKLFNNVQVWLADPWHTALDGSIRNLVINPKESKEPNCVDPCPTGWTSLATGCYKIVTTPEAVSYEGAMTKCKQEKGYLVEMDNQGEQDAIIQFLKENKMNEHVWLGGTDAEETGNWIGGYTGKEIMKFYGWDSESPSHVGSQHCILTHPSREFKWNDYWCNSDSQGYEPKAAVCEYRGDSPLQCPVGWTFLGTGCYKFSPEGTHQEAATNCQNEGGFLIEIDDQEEQDAAFQFYKEEEISGNYIWLGATDDAKEGEWIWSHSGNKMTFTAWYKSEPNGGTSENCLEARNDYGFTWNDQSCDDHSIRGLCERPACPDGWTALATGCYRFSDEGTHREATANCENEGGFLIEIDDQEEQDAALQFYKDEGISENIWLGATDITKEGEWIWSHSGNKLTFTAWHSGEPNGGTDENCLEARSAYDFTWNDESCYDHSYRGLCEYNHKPTIPDCGCGIQEMRKEIAALQVLIDTLQTTSNKNEMDIKTITNVIETNKDGIASNEDAIGVNKKSISNNKDDLATHEDAIYLNNETCSEVKTTAEHLGTCLADVNSPDCPPSGIGKTSMAEAIMENKEDIEGCCGGLMLNPVVLLTGGTAKNSVEVFSIGKNWHCSKYLEDLPDRRSDHTIHFFNGKIILCGSQQNGKTCLFLNENQIFVHHSQLNDYRSYHVGAVVNDKLLISGGFRNPLQMQFWNGLQWEYSGNFNELDEFEMNSCMAAISEDTILMAGGASDRGYNFTNKMLKYKDGKWERMEDYPGVPRRGHGCAFIQTPEGDAFLIAGGTTRLNNYQETSYLYNIEKRQWEEVGNLATGRLGGKVLNVGGRIIIVGGSYGPVEVEEYDVYTKTWSTIPEKLKEIRGQFDAVVVPGALVGC